MKISELGEFELIKRISRKINVLNKDVIKGIGDDAAVIEYDKRYYMLLSTDTMVEAGHFEVKWFTPEQIGKKAVESNVSDIAAMGGFPAYMLVSLALPKSLKIGFVDRFYDGLNATAKKYKIDVIGGNLTNYDKIVVNITIAGFVEKEFLSLRSNAKASDYIFVSGNLGKSRAGLELLKNKKKGKCVFNYLNPKSRLKLARKLVLLGINAMDDVSDGLAQEVINICEASSRGAVIYKNNIPLAKETIKDAEKIGKDPYHYALYGGEDFELVFTAPKNKIKNFERMDVSIVGEMLEKRKGIFLQDGAKKYKLRHGYDSFKDGKY